MNKIHTRVQFYNVDLHNQIIRKYLELLIFIINDFCSHGVQLILAIITCSGWSINYVITFWGPQRPPSPFPGILVTSQRKLLLISSMKKRFFGRFLTFLGLFLGHLHWHDNDILQIALVQNAYFQPKKKVKNYKIWVRSCF